MKHFQEGSLFIIRRNGSKWKRYPSLCHPDRSVASWRDLQFNGLVLEMFVRLKNMNRNQFALQRNTTLQRNPQQRLKRPNLTTRR
jgi:hypothetical protein